MTDLYLVQIFMLRKNMIKLKEGGHIISLGNDIYKLPKKEIKKEWDGIDISNQPRSLPKRRSLQKKTKRETV